MAQRFTFFRSYYESVKELPPEDFKEVLMVLFKFVFENEMPENLSPTAQMFWTLVEPTARISVIRSAAGQIKKESNKNQTRIKPKSKQNQKGNKPQRHKYGEYGHVLLTDEQYSKLIDDFGADLVGRAIKNLDEYCQSSGKSYKDYNLVLRKWPMDEAKKNQKNSEGDFFMRLANGEEHL